MDPKAIALIRVVDDDRAVSKAIQFLLENEDWTVQVFSSGEEFLVNEAPSVPGCIILDVQMGGISGIEVHKELIARESKVPIIFLTAHGDIPMAVEAMKEGAAEFLGSRKTASACRKTCRMGHKETAVECLKRRSRAAR